MAIGKGTGVGSPQEVAIYRTLRAICGRVATVTNSHSRPQDAPFADRSIGSREHDSLGRSYFARQLARRIKSAGTQSSVVFGLSGAWGAGKTSVLDMITEELRRPSGRDHLRESTPGWTVVNFDPWAADDPYMLVEEFYRTIASAIPQGDRSKARAILNAAIPVSVSLIKRLGTGLIDHYTTNGTTQDLLTAATEAASEQAGSLQIEEDPFGARFERIQSLLADLDLRILVVVDDIDRLHLQELLSVLKAVRLLGRFDGVHYLLAYDFQTVIDVLTHSDLANGKPRRAERYLEKIVQSPFELPPIQLAHLAREFGHLLASLAKFHGFVLGKLENGVSERDLILAQLPTDELTLRSVRRLFSQTDMMLTLIPDPDDPDSRAANEINLIDAVLVTFLRLEHPQLYRSLRSWKIELTSNSDSQIRPLDQSEVIAIWRDRIAQSLYNKSATALEITRAYAIMHALFPDSVPANGPNAHPVPSRDDRQIRSREYFERYFSFGISEDDIRDEIVIREAVQLLTTGQLPIESAIASNIYGDDVGTLVQSKLLQLLPSALDEVGDSLQAGDAAIAITNMAAPEDRVQAHLTAWWAKCVYQIWIAETQLRGPTSARRAINSHLKRFGTQITTVPLFGGERSLDLSRMPLWQSSDVVRDSVRDEFVSALFEEHPLDPHNDKIYQLWFWTSKQDGLFEEIRERVFDRLSSEESTDFIDLVARLLEVEHKPFFDEPSPNSSTLKFPDIQTLEAVLGRSSSWPVDQLRDLVVRI